VVAYDFGIKHNILRRLTSLGCQITVVPADYPAEKVMELNPDGVFFSNGPVRSCADPLCNSNPTAGCLLNCRRSVLHTCLLVLSTDVIQFAMMVQVMRCWIPK